MYDDEKEITLDDIHEFAARFTFTFFAIWPIVAAILGLGA